MNSKIIIGDVHGQLDALMQLLDKIPKEFSPKDICFTGDLIDRGNQSAQVVDFVIEKGFDVCQGNHEVFMISNDPIWYEHKGNGGRETLESYKKENNKEFDVKKFIKHIHWMQNLPLYIEYPKIQDGEGCHLVISHSSIQKVWRFRNELPSSSRYEWFRGGVQWDRNLNAKSITGIYNVFGHTRVDYPKIKDGWACIDGRTKLFALQFPEMKIYEVDKMII